MTGAPRVFPAVPVPVAGDDPAQIGRADIVVEGLDQGGPSFELRVYVNNPGASAETEPVPRQGYAGSVYVYGYGTRPEGSVGVRLPMTRYVVATDVLRPALEHGTSVSITLVPVAFGPPDPDIHLGEVGVSVVVRAQ